MTTDISKKLESLPKQLTAPTDEHNKIEKLDTIMKMADFDPDEHPVVLVDVRGREERAKDGCIPHSKNVPLDEFPEALKMTDDEFKAKYGFSKPGKSAYIVLSCWSGMRAQKALEILHANGYTHAKFSAGSYKQYYEDKKIRDNLPEEVTAPNDEKKSVDQLESIMKMADFDPEQHPVVLVDVRGREERAKDGCIPHSKNVPLDEFHDAIAMSDAEFKEKYGFSKPPKDAYIVVSCWSGMRAQKALEILHAAGYSHAKFSSGSYKQYWEAQQQEKEEKEKEAEKKE